MATHCKPQHTVVILKLFSSYRGDEGADVELCLSTVLQAVATLTFIQLLLDQGADVYQYSRGEI